MVHIIQSSDVGCIVLDWARESLAGHAMLSQFPLSFVSYSPYSARSTVDDVKLEHAAPLDSLDPMTIVFAVNPASVRIEEQWLADVLLQLPSTAI